MSDLIWLTTIGFFLGSVARSFLPPRDRIGLVMTEILGIVGAVAATFLFQIAGWYSAGGNMVFLSAGLGALGTLYVYRGLVMKTAARLAASR